MTRKRVAAATAAALGAAGVALARSTGWLAAFGAGMSGERMRRAQRSPQWRGGRFANSEPTRTMSPGGVHGAIRMQVFGREVRYPRRPVPVERRETRDYHAPPASGLRVTWMGHSCALVEIDGFRVLTDPVWSDRVSPSSLAGPKRFFKPPIGLARLPPVDAVVVSHDHYDHLDMATARALGATGTLFAVPLGVGAHLEKWGIPASQLRELDWGEEAIIADVRLTAAPARHFSGRRLTNRDSTLWASWVIAGPNHKVFFCGDSGYSARFREIGREHGPFELTLISTGAYSANWPSVHMTPEEVVQAHLDLRGQLLLPIHWGTFVLSYHGWNEPAARADAAASEHGVPIVLPRPGQMVEPFRVSDLPRDDWWRDP